MVATLTGSAILASGGVRVGATDNGASSTTTTTPIKHLVVIFQENVSFDHYFATYPHAANVGGEPTFQARPGTPTVDGLGDALLTDNPNMANPQRLDRSQAVTCDQNHDYTPEQAAFDHGLMDAFVQNTSDSTGSPPHPMTLGECLGQAPTPGNEAVMDYYDGNTVTALWNYAQHFAMSDNSYSTGFGPSTPGALNLAAGNTYGVVCGGGDVYGAVPACPPIGSTSATPGQPAAQGTGTVYGDPDPNDDICAHGTTVQVGGANVGDSLSSHGVTWGWFQGGFSYPGYVPGSYDASRASQVCTGSHVNVAGAAVRDYSAHHEPFQYFNSTANPRHLPPTSVAMIGQQDQANHQYDLADFWAAAGGGNLPAVSFLKAAKYQDGHAGYSDPLDEQHFLVDTLNRLQRLPEWRSTAVVIAYDDSDGWYDHVMGPVAFQSQTPLDVLSATGQCGADPAMVPGAGSGTPQQARCGYGPRQPLLVVSPFARSNAVDHTVTDQASILRLIEDNWGLGRLGQGSADAQAGSLLGMFDFDHAAGRLFLDPTTGENSGGD